MKHLFDRGRRSVRTVLWSAFFLAACAVSMQAGAQNATVSVYADRDADSQTGCTVSVAGQTLTGIEARLDATLSDDVAPAVTALTRATCSAGAFGAPAAIGAAGAVGVANGTTGSDVVELRFAIADLVDPARPRTRLGFSAARDGADDALFTTNGVDGGAPIDIPGAAAGTPLAIPGPGLWALGALALVFLLIGARAARRARRWAALSLVSLLAVTGVALAANFVADGLIADWAGTTPLATSPAASGTDVDIRAAWVAREGDAFVRLDVAGLRAGDGPTFTSADATTFVVGTAGSFTVVADAEPAATLAVAGALPTGVSFDPASGVLSGNAAGDSGGTFALTFSATNPLGSVSQAFVLTVQEAPTAVSPTAATFTVGQAGSVVLVSTGYPVPTIALTGTLPVGVTYDAASRTLSGTPAVAAAGSYPLAVSATNAAGTSAAQTFTLTLQDAPSFTSAAAVTFIAGTPATFAIAASGTPQPTIALSAGTLPGGVTFDAASGILSGAAVAGSGADHALTFSATNAVGSATQAFTLSVHELPAITSAASTTFAVGQQGLHTATATGFPAPTFALAGDALPTGLTFDATTGALAGAPAVGSAGTYALLLTATNAAGSSAAQPLALTVQDVPVFTSVAAATFTVGAAGTFTVAADGTPPPSLALTQGSLPAGLSFDAASGLLSGTPAPGTGGTLALEFTATSTVGSATQPFVLTVHEQPVLTSPAVATFTAGQAGSFAATATGFPVPTFALAGALPSGLAFAADTGVLSGTPAAGTDGTYALTLTASNLAGDSAPQPFVLTVEGGPAFTTPDAATFLVGTSGSFTVAAGGVPAPSIALTSGTLPSGVSFDPATGLLSGTPAASTGGTHALVFTASNSVGNTTQPFVLTVHEAPIVTSAASATFTVGQSGSFTTNATGFPAPTFALTGALPSGLTFVAATGTLSGTPATGTDGTYPLTLTASNAAGDSAPQSFVLTVEAGPAFTTPDATTFVVGTAGTFTVEADGVPAPSIALTSGVLPSGVDFDPATGILSGTPAATTGGTHALMFTATNSVGSTTQPFVLTVHEAPIITSAASATFTAGQPGTFTATASGFPAPTFDLQGTLPTGVTFSASTGLLQGTPAAGSGGTYPLTLGASNAAGASTPQAFTLTVREAPAFTSAASAGFVADAAGSFAVTASGTPAPTLALTAGTLPSGLNFDPGTGVLGGTPAAGSGGDYALTFSATNLAGSATQPFALRVSQAPAFTSPPLATFITGQPGSFVFAASGFPTPTLTLSGTLPAGLSFDAPSGTLSGTPAPGADASYTLLATASNGTLPDATQSFVLGIGQAPVITSTNSVTCVIGSPCAFTATASGMPAPTFALPGLPAGLAFDSLTGALSGTPDVGTQGSYALTLVASNGVNPDASQAFTLLIGPVITAISPNPIVVGGIATLTGIGFDATMANNTVSIGGAAAAVSGATSTSLTVTVPCVVTGPADVTAVVNAVATPAFPHPAQGHVRDLEVGEAAIVTAPDEVACNELPATNADSEYLVAVYSANTSPNSNAPVQFFADGVVPPAPAPASASLAAGLARPALSAELRATQAADVAHERLLEANAAEYERLRGKFRNDPRMSPAAPSGTLNPVPPTRTFRVSNINSSTGICDSFYVVSATRVFYDGKLAIYEDDATPAGLRGSDNPTMASNYARIGQQFNADMEPIVRTNFGDILRRDAQTDNNGVMVALFTPRINTSFAGVAGFVISCDLFPNDDTGTYAVGGPYSSAAGTNGASNFGEFFYAYQPVTNAAGYSGNTPDNWYRTIRSTFIHETKHVASHVARAENGASFLEQAWLEEGTARHAEELWMRHAVDNQAWESNIPYGSTANPINMYCDVRPGFAECDANARRPASIMQRHFTSMYTHLFGTNARLLSPFGPTASDNASYYYAISWSFVRYVIDRFGVSDADFLTALTQSTDVGAVNLTGRAGASIDTMLGGWALSLAADDYPGLVGATPDIQMPTWNFRSNYAGLNVDLPATYTLAYPLVPPNFAFGTFTGTGATTLRGGGVLWYRLSGTQTDAQLLQLRGNAGAPLPATVRVAVTRVK